MDHRDSAIPDSSLPHANTSTGKLCGPSYYQAKLSEVIIDNGYAAGVLGVLARDNQQLAVVAYHGLTSFSANLVNDLPVAKSALRLALDSGAPVFLERVNCQQAHNIHEFHERTILQLEGFASLASAPLKCQGRTLGVLELFNHNRIHSAQEQFLSIATLSEKLAGEIWPTEESRVFQDSTGSLPGGTNPDQRQVIMPTVAALTQGKLGVEHLQGARDKCPTTACRMLTPREMDVARIIEGGFTSKEISSILCISPLTVNKHRESIRRKLGLGGKKINLTSYLRRILP